MAYSPKFKAGDLIANKLNLSYQIRIIEYAVSYPGYPEIPNDGMYLAVEPADPMAVFVLQASGVDSNYQLVGGSNTLLWVAGGVGAVLLLMVLLKK